MVVLKLLFPAFVWDLFLFASRGCCLLGIGCDCCGYGGLCAFLFGMLLCGFIVVIFVMLIVLGSPLTGCRLCD